MVAQSGISRRGIGIAPAGIFLRSVAAADRKIAGDALPLAETGACAGAQRTRPERGGGQVIPASLDIDRCPVPATDGLDTFWIGD
jgi:hypothetical protein